MDDVLRRDDERAGARREARQIVGLELVIDAALGRDEHADTAWIEDVKRRHDAALVPVLERVGIAPQ
jgi:hypothetical protein